MDYHVFKKPRIKGGKKVYKWYYYYSQDDKRIQKACRGCNNRCEAESYIRTLPALNTLCAKLRIKDIAKNMFLTGSDHVLRREQFGLSVSKETLRISRGYIAQIIERWGDYYIDSLEPREILQYLFKIDRSGSWKNRFLQIFEEIYSEATWNGHKVLMPVFTKFKRNSKRQSVLSTEEINQFLQRYNFSSEMFYVFFTVSLSAGLRLEEARGFKACQFLEEKQAVIVDGFLLPDGERQSFCKTG